MKKATIILWLLCPIWIFAQDKNHVLLTVSYKHSLAPFYLHFRNDTLRIPLDSLGKAELNLRNLDNKTIELKSSVSYDQTDSARIILKAGNDTTLAPNLALGMNGFHYQWEWLDSASGKTTVVFEKIKKPDHRADTLIMKLEENGTDTVGEFEFRFRQIPVWKYYKTSMANVCRNTLERQDTVNQIIRKINIDSVRVQYRRGLFNVIAYSGYSYYSSCYQTCVEDFSKQRYKDFTRLTHSQNKMECIRINDVVFYQRWLEYIGKDFDLVVKPGDNRDTVKVLALSETGVNANVRVYMSSDVLSILGNETNNIVHANASLEIPIKIKPLLLNKMGIVDHIYADFNLKKYQTGEGQVFLEGTKGDSIKDRLDLIGQSKAVFNLSLNILRFGNDFHRISFFGNLQGGATVTNGNSITDVARAGSQNPLDTVVIRDTTELPSLNTLSYGFNTFFRFRKSDWMELYVGCKFMRNFMTNDQYQNSDEIFFYNPWATIFFYTNKQHTGGIMFRYNLLIRKRTSDQAVNGFEVGYSLKLSEAIQKMR